jgi:hypothetical protein
LKARTIIEDSRSYEYQEKNQNAKQVKCIPPFVRSMKQTSQRLTHYCLRATKALPECIIIFAWRSLERAIIEEMSRSVRGIITK